jgi:hypothetical protein
MLASAQIQLGDLPTWLAGLGTVGTLAAALWQIGAERRRRHQREAQESDERHKAQARLIAAVVSTEEPPAEPGQQGRITIDLINGSPEPVYRLVVAIVAIQGAAPRTIEDWVKYQDREQERFRPGLAPVPITTASMLPNGRYQVWTQYMALGMQVRRGAEMAFTDRAGTHWVRRATGQLEELGEDPITHYLGAGPHDLVIPERVP